MGRLLGLGFQFFAQLAHKDAQVFHIVTVFRSPDIGEDVLVGQDAVGMAGQISQQVELGGGQADLAAAERNNVARQVDDQVAGSDHAERLILTRSLVAQGHADAGQQLFGAKGLDQVVIGAQVEGFDLDVLFAAHRQDDDRDLGPGTQLPADLQAVHIGQAQVEDDHRGLLGGSQGQAFFPVLGSRDLVVVCAEDGTQSAQDLWLVIDDEDVRLGGHGVTPLLATIRTLMLCIWNSS